MAEHHLSPPFKKRRILCPAEEGGGEAMESDCGRLLELATLAIWLDEEERRKGKRKVEELPDVERSYPCSCDASGSGSGTVEIADEEERRVIGSKGVRGVRWGCSSSCVVRSSCRVSGTVPVRPAVAIEEDGPINKSTATAASTVSSSGKAGPSTVQYSRSWGGGLGGGVDDDNRPYKKQRTGKQPAPVGWLEMAVRMHGTPPRLVLQKVMSKTDLDPYFARLPLPCCRPADPQRGGVERILCGLSEAERAAVYGAGLPITVMDRWGRQYAGATLKRWPSKWYVVTGGGVWARSAAGNGLKAGDVLEVYSFFRAAPPPPPLPPTPTAGGLAIKGGDEGGRELVLVMTVAEQTTVGEGQQGQPPSMAIRQEDQAHPA